MFPIFPKYILLIHPNYILLTQTKRIFRNFCNLLSTISQNNLKLGKWLRIKIRSNLFYFCVCALRSYFGLVEKIPMLWKSFYPFLTKHHINLDRSTIPKTEQTFFVEALYYFSSIKNVSISFLHTYLA